MKIIIKQDCIIIDFDIYPLNKNDNPVDVLNAILLSRDELQAM